eukprot:sb/3475283/
MCVAPPTPSERNQMRYGAAIQTPTDINYDSSCRFSTFPTAYCAQSNPEFITETKNPGANKHHARLATVPRYTFSTGHSGWYPNTNTRQPGQTTEPCILSTTRFDQVPAPTPPSPASPPAKAGTNDINN